MAAFKYQVALSFAGEQRDYVEEVARHLQSRSIAVFYDDFEAIGLWGRSGVEAFHAVCAEQSAYVVMFISEAYVSKAWPNHERQSALSRMIKEEDEYILPVRFDDTRVPGLPSDIIYECAQKRTPAQLATMIAKKLGVQPFDGEPSEVPPPRMTSPTVPPLVPISNLGSPPEPGRKWVSWWSVSLDLWESSLLDLTHRSGAAPLALTQAGKEWLEWLVWKFAEDCPDAVRGSKTPDPEFNSKVLWWWIRAQAAARGSGKAVVRNDQTVESRASVASERPDQDTESEPQADQASGSVAERLQEAESTNTSNEVNLLQGFGHILARLNRPAVPAMEEGRWISREAAISMLSSSALVRMRLPERHVSDLAESIGRTLLRRFESQYPEGVRNDEYRENLLDWWIDMRTYRQTKPNR